MSQSALLRGVAIFALLGMAVAASGCGGGGAAGTKDLVLVKFLLVDQNLNNIGGSGATNAYRDSRLLFEFNVDVEPASISDRTIRIGIPAGDGLILEALGRFSVNPDGQHANWVLFDPTFSKNNATEVRDNPFGFEANSLYEVRIPSVLDAAKFVTNTAGKGIVAGFTATFQTKDGYLQNFVLPELKSTSPGDSAIDISPTADVILEFTEPMKPDTFVLGDSVIIRDLTHNIEVLGTLRFSADATKVTFRPVFGYGKGPNTIFVRVKPTVANLAGNPIPRELRITFTTRFDNTQPDFGDVTEEFTDRNYQDTAYPNSFPLALWNQGIASGFLAGTFTTGTIELSKGASTYLWPPFAWGANFASQFQAIYYSSEIGTSRTISGMSWYYRCLSASTVTAVTINMGHSQKGSLTTNLPGNFSDTPVSVVSNLTSYSVPQVPSEGWLAMPTFVQTFKYNGSDNLLFEIFNTCGSSGQNNTTWTGLWRVTTNEANQRTAYTQPAAATVTNAYYIDTRFTYLIDRSEAQSLWYDTGLANPQFLDVVLFPSASDQPVGTASTWEFQGGLTDPLNTGSPDLNNLSAWNPDLTKLTGYRFIRFRVTMKGNENTMQVPMYETLILPFIFF
jgi:hypothetical protein